MNRFIRTSLWLFGSIASLLLVLYLLMLAINWSDEHPSSAYLEMTNRLATRQIAPDAENGFIYMMGICAPQGADPSQFGAERIRKANDFLAQPGKMLPDELWQADCSEIDTDTQIIASIRKSCRSADNSCVDTLTKNEHEIEKWLTTNSWQLDRYKRLLAYPQWTTTVALDFRMPFFRYSTIRNMQDMLFFKAWVLAGQGKATDVKQLLEVDIHFWRNLLASADVLLDRAVAINLIRRHFTFGNLILRRLDGNMALLAIPDSWKSPIAGDEISMKNVATGEFAFSASILNKPTEPDMGEEGDASSDSEYFDPFLDQFFQPQATLNETATLLLRVEELFSVQHDNFPETLKAAEKLQNQLGMYHWYNLSGRLLLPMTISTHSSLMTLAYDLEGKRRAALITSMLRAEGIDVDHIAESLAKSDIRDPYTNEPFTWDADSKCVTYCGLQDSDTSKVAYLY